MFLHPWLGSILHHPSSQSIGFYTLLCLLFFASQIHGFTFQFSEKILLLHFLQPPTCDTLLQRKKKINYSANRLTRVPVSKVS